MSSNSALAMTAIGLDMGTTVRTTRLTTERRDGGRAARRCAAQLECAALLSRRHAQGAHASRRTAHSFTRSSFLSAPSVFPSSLQYCYVGVYKNGGVEVIANEQGNRATPACLACTPKERVVGEAAYNHQHLNQANTIYHVSGQQQKLTRRGGGEGTQNE